MSEIKPALTAGEWERERSMDEENMRTPLSHAIGVAVTSPEYMNRSHLEAVHGLAALALYGQPFGFTREDVKRLREWTHFEARSEDGLVLEVFQMTKEWFNSLADRIEALLPPES